MKKQWREQNFCRSEDCFKHRPSKTPQWVNYFAEFLSPLNNSKLPDLHFNCSTVLNSLCKYVEKDQRLIQKKFFFSPSESWAPQPQTQWFAFYQRRAEKGVLGTYWILLPHLLGLIYNITDADHCAQNGSTQGLIFINFQMSVCKNRTQIQMKSCCVHAFLFHFHWKGLSPDITVCGCLGSKHQLTINRAFPIWFPFNVWHATEVLSLEVKGLSSMSTTHSWKFHTEEPA